MYTSRWEGMVGQIRPYKYGIDGWQEVERGRVGGERVTGSTRGCKYRADEFLHPLPVMHDAMLLTLYTPTETTLYSLDSSSATSASSFPRTSPISPRLALSYLFPFISTIESRTYILRPRRALLRGSRPRSIFYYRSKWFRVAAEQTSRPCITATDLVIDLALKDNSQFQVSNIEVIWAIKSEWYINYIFLFREKKNL